MTSSQRSEPIGVTLTREHAWTIYDLTVAKAEAIEDAEMRAETGLGSSRYRQAANELRQALDGPSGPTTNPRGTP